MLNDKADYKLKDVFVMKYSPKYLNMTIKNRRTSTFLYITEGKYHYKSNRIDFIAQSGDIVYIPKNSAYQYSVISDVTVCIQVEFDLFAEQNGEAEEVVFGTDPIVMDQSFTQKVRHLFDELITVFYKDRFLTLSTMYKILSCAIQGDNDRKGLLKIEPALEYINHNYCEKIYVSTLAELCNISESQIRRLFKIHIKMSPIQYKNSLICNAACNMLKNQEMSIGEVSDALQFPDVYTFSQFFKKEIGVSPKRYSSEY